MKSKNMKLEDCEDMSVSSDRVERVMPVHLPKQSRKKQRSENSVAQANPDDDVFIEFILMDMKNLEDLNKFKNMKSLSLIQQGITTIEVIAKSQFSHQIEYLCLNENLLSDMNYVDKLQNLKNLQLSFNNIEKIENIQNLTQLETFWICENRIKQIENLPKGIKTFWGAKNNIEKIEENIKEYSQLNELNISANLLTDFKVIFNLANLPELKTLFINDVNFGECPICLLNNYRIFTLNCLPNLTQLDQILITEEERKEVESTFSKKNLFYKTKIKNFNKTTKSVINMLKVYKTFYIMMKFLQIRFFSKRVKMLEFIEYENSISRSDGGITEIGKELENSKEKMKKCIKGIENINNNFKKVKEFVTGINDFMIVK